MAVEQTIQTAFSAGELAPTLEGHVDFQRYTTSAHQIHNFIINSRGPLVRRGGSTFVAEARDSSQAVRVIPFQFSTAQSYILEFGHLYMRAYRDRGIVIHEGMISGATQANPCVITTSNAHNLETGETTTLTDVVGMTELNGNTYTVTDLGTFTFSLDGVNSTGFGAYSSGGFSNGGVEPFRIVTPYTADELFELQFAQTADTMYIVHNNHAPRKLTRTRHAAWTLLTFTILAKPSSWTGTNFPRVVAFYEQRLFYASTPEEPQTLWGSKSGDFDDLTQGTDDSDGLEYTISHNEVNPIQWMSAGKELALGTSGGIFVASGGTFSDPITPTAVRIVPQSSVGCARQMPIRLSNDVVLVHRAARQVRTFAYVFDSDSYSASDLTVVSDHITESGVRDAAWQDEPYQVYWACLNDGTLLGMTFEKQQKVFGWARHTLGGVSDAVGTQARVESVAVIPGTFGGAELPDELWCVVQRYVDGAIVRYVEYIVPRLRNSTDTLEEDAFFIDSGLSLDLPLSIAAITQADPAVVTSLAHGLENGDQVKIRDVVGMTAVNNRTFIIANVTTNTLELDDEDSTAYDAYIGGGTVRKTATVLSGLAHLEGETVAILADGAVRPTEEVVSGSITIASPGSIIHVGLPYTSTLQTNRIDAGSQNGTAQGKVQRISEATIRLHRTLGMLVGPDSDNLNRVTFRTFGDPLDGPPALFTGDEKVSFPSGYEVGSRVMVMQDQPLPMTILAVITKVRTND